MLPDIVREGDKIATMQLALSGEGSRKELFLNILSIAVLTVLIIVSIALTSIVITRRYISRPLLGLQQSASLIANGDLEASIDTSGRDEIGSLAGNLSAMRDSIKQLFGALSESNHKLEGYSRTLEQKVEERTTELAEAMREAQKARAVAEEANRAKSTFLANMSHELRTPLNAILGFAQLLTRERDLSEVQKENLNVISRSGEHLLDLINDVLTMSKIEAGQTELSEESFDLYRLLDGLESMLRLRAADKGLRLIFERDENVPQYVYTDEGKLRQVLINLLGNGIKFTQQGGVVLRVASRGAAPRAYLLFEIEDTGPGIAAEEVGILFEAFTQTSSGQDIQEGTGLGLPISQQFVRLMGGEIMAHSQVGQGSVFKFEVQVGLVSEVDVKEEQPVRQVRGLEPDQPQYRILVIEDVWENRKLMVNLMDALGFAVREAVDGKEGLEVWEQWEPHLIWMDMRMPVMDGHEATKRIKATTMGQATVVIALTASVFEEQRSVVLSEGCDDFLRKPFREEEVCDLLIEHLGVRFVYEEEAAPASVVSLPQKELTPEALAELSADWIGELRQGAIVADAEKISGLIEQIKTEHAGLAGALQGLLDDFRFDKLMDLADMDVRRD